MTPETLEALKGSIEKWRKIVEERGIDLHATNCPLCQLFLKVNRHCKGCPVDMVTGDGCCNQEWEDWVNCDDYDGFASTPELMGYARAELDFLRSLLPQEEGE